MSCKIPAWAALGWLLAFAISDTAWGQAKPSPKPAPKPAGKPIRLTWNAMADCSYETDFATMLDCLQRVASDEGSTIKVSWIASGWSFSGRKGASQEPFVVVFDERKFPLLKGQQIALRQGRLDDPNKPIGRKVIFDLDTSILTPIPTPTLTPPPSSEGVDVSVDVSGAPSPEGVDVSGVRMNYIEVTLQLDHPQTKASYQVALARRDPGKTIKVSILDKRGFTPARSNKALSSLESKLKLSTKLKEATSKKERGPEADKKASMPQ
jgi:hypothetical protein